MFKFKYFIFINSLLLISCTSTISSNLPDNWVEFKGEKNEYSIGVPPTFEVGKHAIQGKIQGPGFFSKDIEVKIYEPSYSLGRTLCSPTIMGTNTIQNYARDTGGKTVFGIVSSKEKPFEIHTFDDSLCLPPRTSDDADSYWRNHGYDGAGAYVLCSQKEEKTVLICISQMTDNPQLAEEIFSTFRWIP